VSKQDLKREDLPLVECDECGHMFKNWEITVRTYADGEEKPFCETCAKELELI
jgi:formylmethanofuran dehydrogenase subunit E